MAASRLFARRTIVLIIVVCAFMSVLMLTSKQLGQLCDGGSYCDISGLRDKLPKFGNDGTNGHNTNANDKSRKGGQHVEHDSESSTLDDECALFPNTSSVQLIMKTGASESYSKIPTQLMTNLKCVPDFLFFSDMAQKIAGYTIHDSLDTVLDEVKEKNKDFELYHRQKKCPIDQEQCNKNHDVAKQGWDLDKYKNIHMAEKAYKLRPNADWYLFVDADTYVVFPTLMEWLKALDPNKPHYIGSVAYLGGFPFGHGGSGYLVSKAAMHAMFYGKTGVANKYDEPVQHTCCGDYMWSKALKDETGIEVVNAVSTASLDFDFNFLWLLIPDSGLSSMGRNRTPYHMPKTSGANLLLPCTTPLPKISQTYTRLKKSASFKKCYELRTCITSLWDRSSWRLDRTGTI